MYCRDCVLGPVSDCSRRARRWKDALSKNVSFSHQRDEPENYRSPISTSRRWYSIPAASYPYVHSAARMHTSCVRACVCVCMYVCVTFSYIGNGTTFDVSQQVIDDVDDRSAERLIDQRTGNKPTSTQHSLHGTTAVLPMHPTTAPIIQ